MPVYVYRCDEHPEEEREVTHGINDNPVIPCGVCRYPMHRVPQSFRWYMNPGQLLLNKMSDRFNEYRKRKQNVR